MEESWFEIELRKEEEIDTWIISQRLVELAFRIVVPFNIAKYSL